MNFGPAAGRIRFWIGLAGACAILAAGVLIPLSRFGTNRDIAGIRFGHAEWMMGDFKSVAYYPARAFADGKNPYDVARYTAAYPAPEPFRFYPPVTLILHFPIATLPVEAAMTVQFALTVLLTGVLAVLSLRLAGARASLPILFATWGAVLLSRPGHWNLVLGQLTLPVVLACYLAIALDGRQFILVGVALAAALLKPSFGIPLAVLMIARGQLRAVAAGLAMTALVNAPVVLVLAARSGGLANLMRMVIREEHVLESLTLALNRVDLTALLARLSGRSIGSAGAAIVAAAVLGGAVWALRARRRRGAPSPVLDATETGIVCSAILLCTYHITYDFLLLTWPIVSLATMRRRFGAQATGRRWLALGLYGVIAVNYLSAQSVIRAIEAGGSLSLALASINGAALLGLFLVYLHDSVKPALHGGALQPQPAL
jgi:hypothetical protein